MDRICGSQPQDCGFEPRRRRQRYDPVDELEESAALQAAVWGFNSPLGRQRKRKGEAMKTKCDYCGKEPPKQTDCWPTWFGRYRDGELVSVICKRCFTENGNSWDKTIVSRNKKQGLAQSS